MPHAPGGIVKIQRRLNAGAIAKQSLQRIKRAHRTEACRIEFDAVAGGKDDGSGESVDAANRAQSASSIPWLPTANFSRISSGAV